LIAEDESMNIGGLQKVSLIDYPGKISAIIFTQGCNFRCPYCHNPGLVDPTLYKPCLSVKDVLEFLAHRRGKLDAVTITGGEPTLQSDLIPLIQKIRKMGFAVKLDSNGSRPDILARLMKEKLLDYLALDIKAPRDKYAQAVKVPVDPAVISESVRLVLQSKIPHEFRTTVVKSVMTPKDILAIANEIDGAKRYVLQRFQPAQTLDPEFAGAQSFPEEELLKLKKQLEKIVPLVVVR
jgi:pyruvate formate lyase activating enzyme